MKSFLTALLTSTALAFNTSDEHITVKSRAHLGAQPFSEVGPHVQSIFYEDDKATTLKLTRVAEEELKTQGLRKNLKHPNNRRSRGGRRTVWDKIKSSMPTMFGAGEGDQSQTQFNGFNFVYIGPLGFGSNIEVHNGIWDTGSEWIVLESYLCSTCIGGYNYADENGGSFNTKPGSSGERNYGSASTSGFEAYDTVCVTDSVAGCINTSHIYMV